MTCRAIFPLTQHERMCLTAPKLQMNRVLKKKNPSCELSGSCTSSDVNASCHLHCDCRGKRGAEFEDNDAEEANPQLKTRNLSKLLAQPPPPRSNHRLFE